MKNLAGAEDILRNAEPLSPGRRSFVKGMATMGAGIAAYPLLAKTAEAQPAAGQSMPSDESQAMAPADFEGDKLDWHGYDRYDFVMDMQSLAITPFKAPPEEQAGNLGPSAPGQLRCVVVVPKQAAAGKPWSWRGVYWDHQPQAEIELLRRGFHIAYVSVDPTPKSLTEWDAWYAFLTGKYGLSKKPAFVGMSRGGEFEYRWGTAHPDKVSCIYADNPGMDRDGFEKLYDLARADVPVLQICGSIDPIFGRNASAIEAIYQEFGGRISMMVKEGYAHHPHSLRNPKPIADFIEQSVQAVRGPAPAFVTGARVSRTSYYSDESFYRDYPDEGTYITCRGPLFLPCYDRYDFNVRGTPMTTDVIVPNTPAAGLPWVYRVGFVFPNAKVDQALLAKGYHIVTGPVGTNVDGPVVKDWDAVYEYMIGHGFQKKVVMEGAGGGAGEAYAWAIANPDKVFCIYAENPRMHSNLAKVQPLDDLAPLAQAKVPLMHVCGSLDPWFKDNTAVVEKRYRKLGGKIDVLIKKGQGHYPLAPDDVQPVMDFITQATTTQA